MLLGDGHAVVFNLLISRETRFGLVTPNVKVENAWVKYTHCPISTIALYTLYLEAFYCYLRT